MAHHGQVVADEQVGELPLRCRSFMMLSTCACTDTSSALVGSSQTRNSGSVASAGDGDALALPARELVRVLHHVQRRQAHGLEQLTHACFQLGLVGDQAMLLERLADDVFHQPARVQAGIRVLENHLDAPAHGRHCRP